MKLKWLILFVFVSLILAGCNALPFLTKKQSAVQINSTPVASVYINGNHVGQTPYFDDKLKPGQSTVRISVDNDPSKDWQTQVTLNASMITVVSRQFGATSDESSSYILFFEPVAKKDAGQLEITTTPENVIVKVDGRPEGFSPLKLENITAGEHSVVLSAPGYQEMSFSAQAQNGYKINATAQLARNPAAMEGAVPDLATPSAELATPSATPKVTGKITPTPKLSLTPTGKITPTPKLTPSPTNSTAGEISKPYVVIKDTGTGWLRVRSAPEVGDNEVAKVDVGQKFPYLDKTADGWYQIEYETGKKGWIVSRYAELVE